MDDHRAVPDDHVQRCRDAEIVPRSAPSLAFRHWPRVAAVENLGPKPGETTNRCGPLRRVPRSSKVTSRSAASSPPEALQKSCKEAPKIPGARKTVLLWSSA